MTAAFAEGGEVFVGIGRKNVFLGQSISPFGLDDVDAAAGLGVNVLHVFVQVEAVARHLTVLQVIGDDGLRQAADFLERGLRAAFVAWLVQVDAKAR